MQCTHFFRNFVAFFSSIALLITASHYTAAQQVLAAAYGTSSVNLSSQKTSSVSSYTVAFTLATSSVVNQVDFRFSTVADGTLKPAGMNLSAATLGQINNLGSGWNLATNRNSSGVLSISRDSDPEVFSSGTAAVVVLRTITNPALKDCDASTTTLADTCFLKITTYSDNGTTPVDAGTVPFTLREDARLSFEVTGVAAGQTHNGIKTDVTTTASNLHFSTLTPGNVRYAAHALHIATNAPGGYRVYAHLASPITGSDARNTISPFGATDATWSTPQPWSTPTGTSRSDNSGWFGANTTDTRVSGWGSALQKFGPISTVPHIVAQSTVADPGGSIIFITYALGINYAQAADVYSENIHYDIQAIY